MNASGGLIVALLIPKMGQFPRQIALLRSMGQVISYKVRDSACTQTQRRAAAEAFPGKFAAKLAIIASKRKVSQLIFVHNFWDVRGI